MSGFLGAKSPTASIVKQGGYNTMVQLLHALTHPAQRVLNQLQGKSRQFGRLRKMSRLAPLRGPKANLAMIQCLQSPEPKRGQHLMAELLLHVGTF